IWSVMLAVQLAGAGCAAPEPAASSQSAAVTTPPGAVPVPNGCFAKFVQQPPPAAGKVDIVFVADTSGSLAHEQEAVASALKRLISGIDEHGDYHIGVLPAHGSLGSSAGLLWKGEIDLCPTCAVSDPTVAGELLREKFEDLRSDPAGSDPAAD